jgi:hypothetical protein
MAQRRRGAVNTLMRACLVGLVVLLLGLAGLPFAATGLRIPQPPTFASGNAVVSSLPAAPGGADALISRSPFAPTRRPFVRAATPDIQPDVEVRLVGIFKVGGELRASLIVGGNPTTVGVGDATAAGVVASIDSSAVTIEGSPPRIVQIFPSSTNP